MLVEEELTSAIIAAAIDVHRELGPGLLESAYQACLCHEFALRDLAHEEQVPIPLVYKGLRLDCGYRADVIVKGLVIIEIKVVDRVMELHQAQLLTYMKLTGIRVGLIINFNVPVLRNGIVRMVL